MPCAARDVLVVALGRLRRGREERLRQPVGLAQAGRAAGCRRRRRCARSPSSPSRRGSRARRTRAAASRAARTSSERPASSGSRAPSGKSLELRRDHVVAHDVARQREPVQRERREHAALVGDRRRQDDVEGRDAVGGDEQQAVVAGVVDLPHLAGGEVVERERARHELPPGGRMRRPRCAARRPGRRCDRA